MFLKTHPQKCNTNGVSKSHLTWDSMQLYADKWTSRSDLVTDGFFLPSVALISFHGAEWNESEAWTSSITIQYVNGGLTQILICLMATSKCIQLVAMNGGADSVPLTRWAVWVTVSHNGYHRIFLPAFLCQALNQTSAYAFEIIEIYSHSYATFSSSTLGKKHLFSYHLQSAWFNQQMCQKITFRGTTACHWAVPSKGNLCTLFTPKKAHSSTLRVHITNLIMHLWR